MDILTPKPVDPQFVTFRGLSRVTQRILFIAATRGASKSTPEAFAEVGQDWVMVPTKKGARQVVVTAARAFRL